MYQKLLKLNKLYYKKWAYKISCRVKGAYYVKNYGVDTCIYHCKIDGDIKKPYNSRNKFNGDLLRFCLAIKPLFSAYEKQISTRVESNKLSIYCNDDKIFDEFETILSEWIFEKTDRYQQEKDFLFNNDKKVLCDRLPYSKFKFKVALRSTIDTNLKKSLLKWLEQNNKKASASRATISFLNDTYRYIQQPFLYVDESTTVTMLFLLLGDSIKHVNEYIPRHNINTLLCQH